MQRPGINSIKVVFVRYFPQKKCGGMSFQTYYLRSIFEYELQVYITNTFCKKQSLMIFRWLIVVVSQKNLNP